MLAALAVRDYRTAAREALDSKWARQDSPTRARTITAKLAPGKDPQ